MRTFILQRNTQYNRAFTLVEALVAISIFTLSVVAMLVLLGSGIKDTNYAKTKLTASFLAQEGIELVRSIRDTYVLYDGDQSGWGQFRDHMYDVCIAKGCILHTEELAPLYESGEKPITKIEVEKYKAQHLWYHANTGAYDYSHLDSIDSGFQRQLVLRELNPHEMEITSTVFWTAGSGNVSVVFSEDVFDWTK